MVCSSVHNEWNTSDTYPDYPVPQLRYVFIIKRKKGLFWPRGNLLSCVPGHTGMLISGLENTGVLPCMLLLFCVWANDAQLNFEFKGLEYFFFSFSKEKTSHPWWEVLRISAMSLEAGLINFNGRRDKGWGGGGGKREMKNITSLLLPLHWLEPVDARPTLLSIGAFFSPW